MTSTTLYQRNLLLLYFLPGRCRTKAHLFIQHHIDSFFNFNLRFAAAKLPVYELPVIILL